jgi:Fic family protein
MFKPLYSITELLLAQILKINSIVIDLNSRRFPQVVLLELEKAAREVSTFASTSIEGNPLPLTEVKRILKTLPVNIRDSEKEVLNYNQALLDLNTILHKHEAKLSLDLILTIQKRVTQDLLPSFDSGRWREKPVVVNDPVSGQIVYLPPDVRDVQPLMEELIEFTNSHQQDMDPLILAGIFHKQMVIIHPFMDGNGRTARLTTKMLLAQMGINTFNLFSFENYYNRNVTRYFRTVGENGDYYELADKIDFTRWLEYFTGGIIDELLRVQKKLTDMIGSPDSGLRPHHQKLLGFIQEKGYITDRDYSILVDRARSTRIQDFKKLINLGLIERKGKGKATYYILTRPSQKL